MEIILMFVVGFIVFMIAILSVIKMTTHRVTAPTNELKEKVANLENRMDELEKDKHT
jgi:cell division protein FtsL